MILGKIIITSKNSTCHTIKIVIIVLKISLSIYLVNCKSNYAKYNNNVKKVIKMKSEMR